eukprot:6462174-Amphidinium_carterae.2
MNSRLSYSAHESRPHKLTSTGCTRTTSFKDDRNAEDNDGHRGGDYDDHKFITMMSIGMVNKDDR